MTNLVKNYLNFIIKMFKFTPIEGLANIDIHHRSASSTVRGSIRKRRSSSTSGAARYTKRNKDVSSSNAATVVTKIYK